VVGGDDHGTVSGNVLAADPAETKVDVEERLEYGSDEPVDERVGPLLPGSPVQPRLIHRTLAYPFRRRPLQLQVLSPGIDRTRTLRGAVCGAVAGAVWALQQPLDKLVFASRYDDVELLGKAVTRGEAWYPLGLALHMQNGALFGATYANFAPAIPLPPMLRGPIAALAEHLASWPLGALSDRFHPARKDLPVLTGNSRAFAQAAWRHLLFGIVLGELERRVNAQPVPAPPEQQADFSSNGHGTLEHAVSVDSAP
jgi:hypothetical protein